MYAISARQRQIDSGLALAGPLWEGFRESRRCSRDTFPVSNITEYIQYTKINVCVCVCVCVFVCVGVGVYKPRTLDAGSETFPMNFLGLFNVPAPWLPWVLHCNLKLTEVPILFETSPISTFVSVSSALQLAACGI